VAFNQSTSQLQTYLAELYAARSALLLRKSVSIGGKTITMADENWLKNEISVTESKISGRSNGRTLNVVFEGTR